MLQALMMRRIKGQQREASKFMDIYKTGKMSLLEKCKKRIVQPPCKPRQMNPK